MKRLKKILREQFEAQGGKCYYCHQPMWHDGPSIFAREYGISSSQSRLLQATAEHLKARSEGGADCQVNIVAACRYCNGRRHRARWPLTPESHRQKVQVRLAKGQWHGMQLKPIETFA